MSLFDAILLGIIQGLTEFLPVSSSGHLVIAQHLIKDFRQPGVLFDVMLHFGTLGAVIVYFWRDINGILKSVINNRGEKRNLFWLIIAGTIPTGIIAILFKDTFESLFKSATAASSMLLVTGVLLFISDRVKNPFRKDMNLWDAILIGIVQGIAIIPGISRSGSTISTGIFRKIDGETAGRFSFLLSMPAILGAVVLEAKNFSEVDRAEILPYIIGTMVAALFGFLTIGFLMRIIRRRNLSYFAYYCWAVGLLSLLFL